MILSSLLYYLLASGLSSCRLCLREINLTLVTFSFLHFVMPVVFRIKSKSLPVPVSAYNRPSNKANPLHFRVSRVWDSHHAFLGLSRSFSLSFFSLLLSLYLYLSLSFSLSLSLSRLANDVIADWSCSTSHRIQSTDSIRFVQRNMGCFLRLWKFHCSRISFPMHLECLPLLLLSPLCLAGSERSLSQSCSGQLCVHSHCRYS